MSKTALISSRIALCAGLFAMPAALSAENPEFALDTVNPTVANLEALTFTLAAVDAASGSETESEGSQQSGAQSSSGGEQSGEAEEGEKRTWPKFQMPKIVFDDTYATVGIGAAFIPSYTGSDDYIVFPLPLIVGRVGGVGIRPNGPGVRLDFLSPAPALGPRQDVTFNLGPTIRFRNERAQQIQDEVVELAEDLDVALEVGIAGGITLPGVFNPNDSLTFNTAASFDVLGAHDGFLIEPNIGYARPFGLGVLFQASLGAQFVDDNFADYYYTVTPEQSAATGLAEFTASGGLNSLSSNMIVNFDLDGNALNGGLSIYTILGYTRLVGDSADTPFTSERGDANQFFAGAGVAYTF